MNLKVKVLKERSACLKHIERVNNSKNKKRSVIQFYYASLHHLLSHLSHFYIKTLLYKEETEVELYVAYIRENMTI